MEKNLLIIESPNKIETLSKYLKNKDFKIIATVGHIRDIATRGGTSKMGYNLDTLNILWVVPSLGFLAKKVPTTNLIEKKQIIANIQEAARNARNIYIATDPDREGEAIAWHVEQVLDEKDRTKVHRITFNEITEQAVLESLKHPRKIDMDYVHSQFARRIIDRFIGFKLSKLVMTKFHAISAGRVQTIALKFIADREKEIEAFKSTGWWTIRCYGDVRKDQAELKLRAVNDKLKNKVKYDEKQEKEKEEEGSSELKFKDEASAQLIAKSLSDHGEIYAIDEPRKRTKNPPVPYKMATLQTDAINKLGWTTNKVTKTTQDLYEGIKWNGEHVALISYPRTDEIRISDVFAKAVEKFIVATYGKEYFQFRDYAHLKPAKTAKPMQKTQGAHEAIRVIDPNITPSMLKDKVSNDEYRLYKLIWERTIGAFMLPSTIQTHIVRINNNGHKFYAYEETTIFDGYKKIYGRVNVDDAIKLTLKDLRVGEKFNFRDTKVEEHHTEPPPRYNQGSLITALDESGVGRPSTFRTMANVGVDRGYVHLESKAFVIEPIGKTIIDNLEKHFPDVINIEFTRKMEEHLDEIADGDENWKKWISNELSPHFDKEFDNAMKKIAIVPREKTGEKCPLCGHDLEYRYTKKTHAKFISCSNYPKCVYAEWPNPPHLLDKKCPLCHNDLIERTNKRGQKFVGCTGWPKCHFIANYDKEGNIVPAKKSAKEKKRNNAKH